MKHIIAYFGLGALQLAAWGICIGLAVTAMRSGGAIYSIVCSYIQGMCG